MIHNYQTICNFFAYLYFTKKKKKHFLDFRKFYSVFSFVIFVFYHFVKKLPILILSYDLIL
ncbi:hypothetical protein B0178_01935 [Streptococcus pseudopneumoniae]|nr:hypothetical protein B0178_01935 [Streptococcus pseudopneumoniae]